MSKSSNSRHASSLHRLYLLFVVFTLPWLVIPQLKMRRAVKISLYGVFLVGIINMAATVVRMTMIEIQWQGGLGFMSITFMGKSISSS
jgi:hypothetical protein